NHAGAGSADMQRRAPASAAMRINQLQDGCRDAVMMQRRFDEPALPGAIIIAPPVLKAASAAAGEFRAEWCDARRAGREDFLHASALAGAGNSGNLARQDIGDVDFLSLELHGAFAVTADFAGRH